jgi:hypothetical protein
MNELRMEKLIYRLTRLFYGCRNMSFFIIPDNLPSYRSSSLGVEPRLDSIFVEAVHSN